MVPRWRRRLAAVAAAALLVGVPAGIAAALYEPARLGADGRIVG